MRLHEEYITRHRLEIPVIRFDSRSNLFLKTKDAPFRWSIFNITWRPQSGRPGFFEFVRMEPIHDGHGAFRCAERDKYVYWDQYDNEVTKIVKHYKENGYYAVQSKARSLMAWELFLFMFDGWLSEKMDASFYKQVEISTTTSLDVNTRMMAYRCAVRYLSERKDSERQIEMLNYQIMPMISGHSQWLEQLINA